MLECDLRGHRLTFPSTFVNGRSRELIMVEMRQRIARGEEGREIAETIQVMFGDPVWLLMLTG